MKLTEHQLDIALTAVGTMVIRSSLVNSQAAIAHSYPRLHPIFELIPDVKASLVNMWRKYPIDSQFFFVIDVVFSFEMKRFKKRPGFVHI